MDWKFEELEELREDVDLEVKLALGENAKGALPKDFWESYSAMANTQGGYIVLGVQEDRRSGEFKVVGMPNPEQVVKSLWDGLNNPQKASLNLLSDRDVVIRDFEGRAIIQIWVPEATRSQRPVYINGNPMIGTFRRNYEGDYRCPKETVNRMMAEQVEDARDARLLEGYDFADLNLDSIKAYRNQFQSRQPDHPWNDCEMREFLRNIGAWSVDRKTGDSAPTVAGVLMFGNLRSILDALPNYVVDYQERPQAKAEKRWVDRLTTDGSWSGNLYDFYRQVIRKLHSELKVPFQLKGAERVEDTPVHVALREALVNTLIHADYSGRISVLVVKRPDLFGFRNPGGLRIPLADAKRGGTTDCRNRNLQKMFQLLGAGEQAGSGIPKIYDGWNSQHWRQPEFMENITADREETLLRLRMVSLLPEDTVEELGLLFGSPFYQLPDTHRMALVTAAIEGSLTHARLLEMTNEHPHDLSGILHDLIARKMLESDGTGRGTYYFLPGRHPVGGAALSLEEQEDNTISEVQHKGDEVQHSEAEVQHKQRMEEIVAPLGGGKRAKRETVEAVIVKLCAIKEMSCQEIADLLNRSEQTIQNHYLNKMCDTGLLETKFPIKHHPKQRYRAK